MFRIQSSCPSKCGSANCDYVYGLEFCAEKDIDANHPLYQLRAISIHMRYCSVISIPYELDKIGKKYERF
jgi:hypothetical protein